jgi:hypothetical protein
MQRTALIPAAAAAILMAAGCGSDEPKEAKAKPSPAAPSSVQLPYGTYTRTVSKSDIIRTEATRDEGGPSQEGPPAGVYRLVIAKGADGPVLKVTDPTDFTIDMNLGSGPDGELLATTYVDPSQSAFCGPAAPEAAVYAFTTRGAAMQLAPKPSDRCADRDSILTGRWTRG